ncbi:MAG: UTRA domain-containing protein, partial [Sciscionella sp.]
MAEWVTASTPYLSPRADGQADPWAREATDAGHVGRHKVLSADEAIPPALVAALLGIEPGTRAVRRRRIVTLDERPVEIADSWY